VIYKATNVNGLLAMLIGCGITVAVQSSSITTSVLTPLVGVGVIQLEQMFPLTLGANIGTTITGLLASMVSDSVDALQVALAHLFFNVSGIIIW
jgi:sodium-dependent phosphate cotransporter